MGCQAVSDGRDSKTIKKDKQESFELSPNINRYKKAYKPCTIGLYHLDIMSAEKTRPHLPDYVIYVPPSYWKLIYFVY